VDHIIRKPGDEFLMSDPPNPSLFLELSEGDNSPVSAGVPRGKQRQQGFAEPSREGDDDIEDLL
tara:strand:+ start:3809 stop:4000 length:192 start_codon:yes stop_codon:yes gene_type:complete